MQYKLGKHCKPPVTNERSLFKKIKEGGKGMWESMKKTGGRRELGRKGYEGKHKTRGEGGS